MDELRTPDVIEIENKFQILNENEIESYIYNLIIHDTEYELGTKLYILSKYDTPKLSSTIYFIKFRYSTKFINLLEKIVFINSTNIKILYILLLRYDYESQQNRHQYLDPNKNICWKFIKLLIGCDIYDDISFKIGKIEESFEKIFNINVILNLMCDVVFRHNIILLSSLISNLCKYDIRSLFNSNLDYSECVSILVIDVNRKTNEKINNDNLLLLMNIDLTKLNKEIIEKNNYELLEMLQTIYKEKINLLKLHFDNKIGSDEFINAQTRFEESKF